MGKLSGGLSRDERGASPVIGIVLIVALTIVLAAIIGQSVFGFDLLQSPDAAPAVSFGTDYDEASQNLTIVHESGTRLENGSVTFVVSGGSGPGAGDYDAANSTIPATIESGNDVVLAGIAPDETVRIVWESPETGDSYVVYTWEGPEA